MAGERAASASALVSARLLLQTWKGDLKDLEHGVDVGTAVRLVGCTHLETILRQEVVVIGDEQEVVVRQVRVENARKPHGFPFFRQIVLVVRRAVVQAEAGKLGVVVEIDEGCQRRPISPADGL